MDCFVFILLGVLWTSWICILESIISVEKSRPLLLQIFFSILFSYLFLVFLLYICYTFCNCPTVFGYSDSLTWGPCFKKFSVQFEKLLLTYLKSFLILSSVTPSLLMSSSKAFFISVSVFSPIISIRLFLRVSISLLTLPICFACCPLLLLEPLAYESCYFRFPIW